MTISNLPFPNPPSMENLSTQGNRPFTYLPLDCVGLIEEFGGLKTAINLSSTNKRCRATIRTIAKVILIASRKADCSQKEDLRLSCRLVKTLFSDICPKNIERPLPAGSLPYLKIVKSLCHAQKMIRQIHPYDQTFQLGTTFERIQTQFQALESEIIEQICSRFSPPSTTSFFHITNTILGSSQFLSDYIDFLSYAVKLDDAEIVGNILFLAKTGPGDLPEKFPELLKHGLETAAEYGSTSSIPIILSEVLTYPNEANPTFLNASWAVSFIDNVISLAKQQGHLQMADVLIPYLENALSKRKSLMATEVALGDALFVAPSLILDLMAIGIEFLPKERKTANVTGCFAFGAILSSVILTQTLISPFVRSRSQTPFFAIVQLCIHLINIKAGIDSISNHSIYYTQALKTICTLSIVASMNPRTKNARKKPIYGPLIGASVAAASFAITGKSALLPISLAVANVWSVHKNMFE